MNGSCKNQDRHNAKLVCGYPLPCPYHTVLVVVGEVEGQSETKGKKPLLEPKVCPCCEGKLEVAVEHYDTIGRGKGGFTKRSRKAFICKVCNVRIVIHRLNEKKVKGRSS